MAWCDNCGKDLTFGKPCRRCNRGSGSFDQRFSDRESYGNSFNTRALFSALLLISTLLPWASHGNLLTANGEVTVYGISSFAWAVVIALFAFVSGACLLAWGKWGWVSYLSVVTGFFGVLGTIISGKEIHDNLYKFNFGIFLAFMFAAILLKISTSNLLDQRRSGGALSVAKSMRDRDLENTRALSTEITKVLKTLPEQPNSIEQLTKLAELKEKGHLSEAEFEAQKTKLLRD